MKSLICNSHNIIGIPTSASLSEIRKKGNHLISLSKIDETEQFESDIGNVSQLRNEITVKQALDKLTSVQDRLVEAFLWFDVATKDDQTAFDFLHLNEVDKALKLWKKQEANGTSWIAKKNHALSSLYYSFVTKSPELYKEALLEMREIWKSDNFWAFYRDFYRLHDDMGISTKAFDEISKDFPIILARYSADIYEQLKKPEIIGNFYSCFATIPPELDVKVITPILETIRSDIQNALASNKITTTKFSENKIATSNTNKIYSIIDELEKHLSILSSFEIDVYPPIKAFKENCADSLRSLSVSVHNELNSIELANKLLNMAISISEREEFRLKASQDKKQLNKNLLFENILVPKLKELEGKSARLKYKEFRNVESEILRRLRTDSNLNDVSTDELNADLAPYRRRFIVEFSMEIFIEAKVYFDKQDEVTAENLFLETFNLVKEHLHEFQLNKEKVLKLVDKVISEARAINTPEALGSADKILQQVRDITEGINVDDNSKVAFFTICQAALYKEICPYVKRIRIENKYKKIFGTILGNLFWLIILVLYLLYKSN